MTTVKQLQAHLQHCRAQLNKAPGTPAYNYHTIKFLQDEILRTKKKLRQLTNTVQSNVFEKPDK